jgi:hypothetical protein
MRTEKSGLMNQINRSLWGETGFDHFFNVYVSVLTERRWLTPTTQSKRVFDKKKNE